MLRNFNTIYNSKMEDVLENFVNEAYNGKLPPYENYLNNNSIFLFYFIYLYLRS